MRSDNSGCSILISAPFGYSIKNILYSSFWQSSEVKQASRITVLSPSYSVWNEYFRENSIDNAKAVDYPTELPSRLFTLIWELRKVTNLKQPTETAMVKWEVLRKTSPVRYFLKRLVVGVFMLVPHSLQDSWLMATASTSKAVFETPDIWLSLAPSFEIEVPLMKKITTEYPETRRIGFVHSWDNLSSKGLPPIKYNKVLVWGSLMKEEVKKYLEYSDDQIIEVGMPQYDHFLPPVKTEGDHYLYCTGHKNTIPNESFMVSETLRNIFANDPSAKVIIRLHPNDTPDRYQKVLKGFPKKNITVEEPGRRTEKSVDLWEPLLKDVEHYSDLLRRSKVVINVASSVSLDASYYNRPVILLAFDKPEVLPDKSNERYYRYSHYRPLIESDGYYYCNTPESLLSILEQASSHPKQKGQASFFHQHCPNSDGLDGKRIGDALK